MKKSYKIWYRLYGNDFRTKHLAIINARNKKKALKRMRKYINMHYMSGISMEHPYPITYSITEIERYHES